MDDGGLDSLAESIGAIGVKEPLLVAPAIAGKYEVIAGHRRLLAARIAGVDRIPCIIETDRDTEAAIRLHENIEREDLNVADEAMFLGELYEQQGEDVDKVANAVRKSRAYVEERLLLLRGAKEVYDALREGKITFGVARELNKLHLEKDKLYYLNYAIRGGASIRQVREWRTQANVRAELEATKAHERAAVDDNQDLSPPAAEPQQSYLSVARPEELTGSTEKVACFMCGKTDEMWRFIRKFACMECADKYLLPAEKAIQSKGE